MGGSVPAFSSSSVLLISLASSMVFPFAISVIMLLVATTGAHPVVWNLMSFILFSWTLMYIHTLSPQLGFSTIPMPFASSIFPQFRGFFEWSFSWSL